MHHALITPTPTLPFSTQLDATQTALDAAYASTFGGVEYVVDGEEATRVWPRGAGEAEFASLGRDDTPALRALLAAVQTSDPPAWAAFQTRIASLKNARGKLAADLAAVEGTLERARSDARAAARRAADAAAASPSSPPRSLARPVSIVLVTGFETFNARLYDAAAAAAVKSRPGLAVSVFTDTDITGPRAPALEAALATADLLFTSLVFDYDQVEWLIQRSAGVTTRLNFECALELMSTTRLGGFTMAPKPGGAKAGPPPAVKKILSLFGSGREEDRMVGYLSFLKIGPALLKFVPGQTAADLRRWLTAYAYWNAGGKENVGNLLTFLADEVLALEGGKEKTTQPSWLPSLTAPASPPPPPAIIETPQTGCIHPGRPGHVFASPSEYVAWYQSSGRAAAAPPTAPRVAVLLYRKHVISSLPYIPHLITLLEEAGVVPIPIFINGVEGHTVVRDVLTTESERAAGASPPGATPVDAVVSTIGFPLVGGPAGTMEGGRQADVARDILSSKDVPYVVAAPLLIQDLASWTRDGVAGLQSVVLYSLPELDGAIDAVPLGGLAGGDIFLVPERVRALAARLRAWHALRSTRPADRRVAALTYGFPPGVGATGTAALLNVPRSIDAIVAALEGAGYDVGAGPADEHDARARWASVGQSIIDALAAASAPAAVSRGAAGLLTAGVGDAARYGATPTPGEVSPSTLKDWLSFSPRSGPSDWGPIPFLPSPDILVRRLDAQWTVGSPTNICHSAGGAAVVPGVSLGNVWFGVQPLLGVEGDPMRLLFERDLTPHPQYVAAYLWLQREFKAHGECARERGGWVGERQARRCVCPRLTHPPTLSPHSPAPHRHARHRRVAPGSPPRLHRHLLA